MLSGIEHPSSRSASAASARALRRKATDAENRLWYHLQNRNISGAKFRRQESIGPYIVDFVSFEKKLIIELDGSQHSEAENTIRAGNQRTTWLETQGFKVLRFWDNDVFQNSDGVVTVIMEAMK